MPIYPIVGVFHHRPAKAILAVLPIGTELELIPEPENPYDPNAIAVWIDGQRIPPGAERELNSLASGYGYTAQQIFPEMWMLGYIPREIAAKLQPFKMQTGKFCTGADGGPKVEVKS